MYPRPETSDVFKISLVKTRHGPKSICLLLPAAVQEVFVSDNQDLITLSPTDRTTSAPKDMVSWLSNHPLLETSKPVPVTVGGQRGGTTGRFGFPGLKEYAPTCTDPSVFSS